MFKNVLARDSILDMYRDRLSSIRVLWPSNLVMSFVVYVVILFEYWIYFEFSLIVSKYDYFNL